MHADQAARQAAYMARKGLVRVPVDLPAEVAEALDAYMVRHAMDGAGLTRSQVLAKLITAQLLRKR